jgi:competence protein ComEA
LPVRPVVAIGVSMNLRLPIVATIVVVAVAATALHAGHRDPAPFTTPPPGDATAAAEAPARRSPAAAPEHAARVTVYVAGEVARPGVYGLPATARAVDAVRAAGGATADADPVAVNLARHLVDGEEIVVPVKGSTAALEADAGTSADAASTSTRRGATKRHRKHRKRRSHHHAASRSASDPATSSDGGSDTSADAPQPTETVDLNVADENELEALPGIGSSLASRIVAFREINGPFTSPDDLLDVGGMTQSRLDAIAPYVTAR